MKDISVKVEAGPLEATRADLLIIGIFEKEKGLAQSLKKVDGAAGNALKQVIKSGDFSGRLNQRALIYPKAAPFARLMIVGLGGRKKFSAEIFRRACGFAGRETLKSKSQSAAVALPSGKGLPEPQALAKAAVEGIVMGAYRFTDYKTVKDDGADLKRVIVRMEGGGAPAAVRRAAETGRVTAQCVNIARDMANTPALDLPPEGIAKKARSLAKAHGFSCKALGAPELKRLKMNALLAVGGGSSRPPRLVELSYKGSGKKGERPIVLVGKGIAFDSGGINLKPGAGMDKMKDDMSGAAAVLATVVAAARLKVKKNIVGLLACAENLPDGKSYRPGDVIRTASDVTVEVTNTDAEGRMVLCDALHHARKFNPRAVVDVATLTGAATIIMGQEAAILMGNDGDLRRALHKAGDESGERCWPLPLWADFEELLKSDIADIKNSGSRSASSIQGGIFLKRFVKGMKWAHLDIANLAWSDRELYYRPRGATGAGARILTEFLQNYH